MAEFAAAFKALTGNDPFPWQEALYARFAAGDFPATCNLPTGLGKTNVLAVWLVALANHPDVVPRRLVYVVNRRTVVDQTTDVAVEMRKRLTDEKHRDYQAAQPLRKLLAARCGHTEPLAISTLRGQYADNREWSADPSRPAIICGTVDMIGSRLLFGGYGLGFKSRPLHAGFLGQDVLLVHDEAHLEPAFQKLLTEVEVEQRRCKEFTRFHVIELSATSRAGGEPFVLTPDDYTNKLVQDRVNAQKTIALHRNADPKKLADELAALALKRTGAVLVFTRKVEDVEAVCKKLPKGKFEKLTGTLRGKERDELVGKPIFQRFLPKAAESAETVFLVCTSAGEVGVNISADHLVCDLSTFDSMAQRFGRVNRFGLRDANIDVAHPTEFDDDDPTDVRRRLTLALLEELAGDGSPAALGKLPAERRVAAFAVEPTLLGTSDILFDAWALTTVRDKLPGRPKVEPYLHGVTDREPPETHVAWRQEVSELDPDYTDDDTDADRKKKRAKFEKYAAELLEDYPLKPHELLREPSHRAFKHLTALAERHPRLWAWLVDDDGAVQHLTLRDLADKDRKDRINGATVLLPPAAGGLSGGQLDGSAEYDEEREDDYDVADWHPPAGEKLRERTTAAGNTPKGWRLVRSITLAEDEDGKPTKVWRWLVKRSATDEAGAAGQSQPYGLAEHNRDARDLAAAMCERLNLPADLAAAVTVAAGAHDLGKDRAVWQRSIGNKDYPQKRLAKSGHRRPPEQVTHYRHEFGSLLDVVGSRAFKDLADKPGMQELCRHLIAAHHGRGRPHFPPDEVFDPGHPHDAAVTLAASVPGRFARLQRKYGRWGLAYLESLVRAADVLASKQAEEGGDQ